MRDENQLHAAVVELVALDDAEIKYSTVQNWYPGDAEGKGGIYNFVTKRALVFKAREQQGELDAGRNRQRGDVEISVCVLNGENSVGEFYSVAVTNNYQQADTGTKMIHNGKGSRSTIVSRASAPDGATTPIAVWSASRPMPKACATSPSATACCSARLAGAHTVPYIEVRNPSAQIEHEATTSKISTTRCSTPCNAG